MKRRFLFVTITALLLLLAGCSLLQEPPQPVIPTPIPTAPPLPGSGEGIPAEQVTDPVSDIVPAVDPEIVELDNRFVELSKKVREKLDKMSKDEIKAGQKKFIKINSRNKKTVDLFDEVFR